MKTYRDYWRLSLEEVQEQADWAAAEDVYRQTAGTAWPNSLEPFEGFIPEVGTWRFDPNLQDYEVLCWVPVDEVTPAEHEDGIKERWTNGYQLYPLYVQWAKEGRQAPPVTVFPFVDTRSLKSLGRRRTLAAKDAGLTHILAWFSETNERGGARWRIPR